MKATTLTTTTVVGKEVKIGDIVGFKCDVEQYGQITGIERDRYGKVILILKASHQFTGEYIGGQQVTKEMADDCWL